MGTRIMRGSIHIETDEMNLGELKEAIEITGDVAGVPPDAKVTSIDILGNSTAVAIWWELRKDPLEP
jgi:hypothetical protein